MLLQPRKLKFKKQHKGRISKGLSRATELNFGSIGLYACESTRLTAKQIESSRLALLKTLKKNMTKAKLWLRVFPNIPVTKKPAEVRMGKGKGSVDHWQTRVQKNRLLWELSTPNLILAKRALKAASFKLPIKTAFKIKEDDSKN